MKKYAGIVQGEVVRVWQGGNRAHDGMYCVVRSFVYADGCAVSLTSDGEVLAIFQTCHLLHPEQWDEVHREWLLNGGDPTVKRSTICVDAVRPQKYRDLGT